MLNNIIHTPREQITAIVAKIRSGEYFVDNSFQRRLVWSEKQRARLIETILMSYPMPEIYLWQQPSNPATGSQTFSVVDGQQRLTTITQFVSNEFPLKAAYLDKANQEADFADKYFKDLGNEYKTAIWDYVINVRQIPSTVTMEQVQRLFIRLNETDRSLNPQELRHAEFNGEFITNAARLADLPLWEKWHFFTPIQLRRMADVEFCSGLLIFLRSGIADDSPRSLNQVYDLFNEKYDQRDADFADAKITLERIDLLAVKSPLVSKLFLASVHLYALFAALHTEVGTFSDEKLLGRLEAFAVEYDKDVSDDKLIGIYREASASRTRSKASREKRVASLVKWLLG